MKRFKIEPYRTVGLMLVWEVICISGGEGGIKGVKCDAGTQRHENTLQVHISICRSPYVRLRPVDVWG